jgi:hypothetical protein
MHRAALFPLLLLSACAGEVTLLDFGSAQEDSFERYRAEIQPILAWDDPANPTRNCAFAGACHSPPLGVGGFIFSSDPDEAALNANHQAVLDFISPNDPAASKLLVTPLPQDAGGRGAHALSFPNTDDCCYQKILTWIDDAPTPDCACPTE